MDLNVPQPLATSQFRHTSFSRLQHDDGQAIESLAGVSLPTDGMESTPTNGEDVFRPRLDMNGLGGSPYLGTDANVANWRSADRGQYMWQGNGEAENNWGSGRRIGI